MKSIARGVTLALLLAATVVPVAAQDPPEPFPATAQSKPNAAAPEQPLQVQIVIARYLNDKRVSSLPFSLSMSTARGSKANVRMGGNVPVPTTVFTPVADNSKPTPLTSYNFQNVGTNIDVVAVATAAGRIGLNVTISETTLKPVSPGPDPGSQVNVPSTNNYQSSNTVFVKDGETAQFTAATDRLSGEVVRIEVTAKVVK